MIYKDVRLNLGDDHRSFTPIPHFLRITSRRTLFHTTTFIGAVHKVLRTLLHCVGFKVDETVLG